MPEPRRHLGQVQLSFSTLPELPDEIIDRILFYYIAPQETVVGSDGTLVEYACSTDALAPSFSPRLSNEYWRIRHLSWLNDAKAFTCPRDLYLAHHILAQHPQARLPSLQGPATPRTSDSVQALVLASNPFVQTHGLEKIILDLDAGQYFALFDVRLPPFDVPSNSDSEYQASASVLQHCRELTLVFGDAYRYAHPWLDVEHPDWEEARYRPHVCEMGEVVDLMLEAAWRNNYLQHIPTIKLEGEIQAWVRTKWERIFAEGAYQAQEARIVERPWEIYPPACMCRSGCWKIGLKKMW